MKSTRVLHLFHHFSEEKVFFEDVFLRIRRIEGNQIELSCLRSDACGASVPAPRLRLRILGDVARCVNLLDLYATPVRALSHAEENAPVLEEALVGLVELFEHASLTLGFSDELS